MKSNRCFGVELESHPVISGCEIADIVKKNAKHNVFKSKWRQTYNNDYWHIKTDSTCGGGQPKGWEIASFKASGNNDILEICKVTKKLKKAGLKCGTDCGLHVHVDISDFSVEQVGILLAYWVKVENVVLKTVPESRLNNKHCMPIAPKINKKIKWTALDFWHEYKPSNISIHRNEDKRVTMNLVNFVAYKSAPSLVSTRATVEFRFPEGTFNERDVKNWIILFVNFVDGIKDKLMPKNLRSVTTATDLIKILSLEDDNQKWFFHRICKFDLKNKWRKIAKNILDNDI